jgi:hypothetical protein
LSEITYNCQNTVANPVVSILEEAADATLDNRGMPALVVAVPGFRV